MLPGSSYSGPKTGLTIDDLNYDILEKDVIVDSIMKEIISINAKAGKKKKKTRTILKLVISQRQNNVTTNFPI